MLHPHSSRDAPNFNVIVFGVVPTVRAEVIYEDASLSNIIFMRGPTETSAELAIQGLLDTSMVALDQQYNANVFRDPTERWNAARLENGRGSGWYSGQ